MGIGHQGIRCVHIGLFAIMAHKALNLSEKPDKISISKSKYVIYGIYGVLTATIISLVYRTTDFFCFVSRNLAGGMWIKDLSYMAVSAVVSVCMIYTFQLLIPEFYNWLHFFGYAILSVIISSLAYLIVVTGFYRKSVVTALLRIFRLLKGQVNR
jgi:hypothetical protein